MLTPQEIKSRFDSRGVLESAGYGPSDGDKITCPFHSGGQEKTPSLHLYPDGGWYCFGSCQEGGDVISLVGRLIHGNSYDKSSHYADVCEYLTGVSGARVAKRKIPPRAHIEKKPREFHYTLRDVDDWHKRMDKEPREWCHDRYGLSNETMDQFDIGLGTFKVPCKGGVYRAETRIVIPCKHHDELTGIKIRSFPGDAPPKYLWRGKEGQTIFNLDAITEDTDQVIITEGEIDAIRLCQMGMPAISATSGSGLWKQEWNEHISHVRNVFLCFDNDETGRKSAVRFKRHFRRATILDWLPPELQGEYKDISEFLRVEESLGENYLWRTIANSMK